MGDAHVLNNLTRTHAGGHFKYSSSGSCSPDPGKPNSCVAQCEVKMKGSEESALMDIWIYVGILY